MAKVETEKVVNLTERVTVYGCKGNKYVIENKAYEEQKVFADSLVKRGICTYDKPKNAE